MSTVLFDIGNFSITAQTVALHLQNIKNHPSENTFMRFGMLAIFHLSFFIFITTIGLNIIFGIIVDTFSELRDRKWMAERDMRDTCFICGRSSYDFEHHGYVSPESRAPHRPEQNRNCQVDVWLLLDREIGAVAKIGQRYSIDMDTRPFQGFESHINQEHHTWAYIFFFIHLHDTKQSDYTALELFVFKLVRSEVLRNISRQVFVFRAVETKHSCLSIEEE